MGRSNAVKNEQVVENQVVENAQDEYGEVVHPAPAQESLEGLMEQFKTKSAVMRHLESKGWTRGQIAKFMNVRYQHVRNVLIQPLKKNG